MATSCSIALFVFAATHGLCFVSSFADLPTFNHAAKSNGSLSFLVLGDWGRKGEYNQSIVAYQMGKVGEKLDIDFVISTGDNFYDDGLTGIYDKQFEESFTNIYTAKSLQKQWYSVLGNHDYRGNVLAQLSPILKMIDRRWLCMRSFIVNAEIADIIFVDTSPFVEKYWNDPKDHKYDWRGVTPRQYYMQYVIRELRSALKESWAPWKVVVAHHTIRSAGHHGATEELEEHLLPLLREHNVDFYMNGHDHCLQHVTDSESPIQFFTSGGGSKAWRGDVNEGYKNLKFFHDGQGFMSVELSKADADINFYDVTGMSVYRWHLSRNPYAAV